MASSINASTTAGVVTTADTSGVLNIQTAGTTAVSISASQVVTLTNALAEASGGTGTSTGYYGFKNRIINGAMVIDQRNAGASVTVNNNTNAFIADRWFVNGQSSDGVFTGQQVTTAPAGFNNSLKFTVTTADASIGATQEYVFRQRIEGYNFADLGWGTANAQTITISFWVQSSVTGAFGGSLCNGNGDRAYPFSFTINSANTWEQKSVTIAGDTTGTWLTTNGTASNLIFSLGVGSTYKGTAGAWGSTFYFAPTGSVNLISTNGATFYITGVQLEKGATATSFDYRPYGTELALCQRYYQVKGCVVSNTSGAYINTVHLPVSMRATPTIGTVTFDSGSGASFSTLGSQASGSLGVYQNANHSGVALATSIPLSSEL